MTGKDTCQRHAANPCTNVEIYPNPWDSQESKSDVVIKSHHEKYYPASKSEIAHKPSHSSHGMHCSTQNTSQQYRMQQHPSPSDRKELKRALKKTCNLRDRQFGRRLQLKEKRNELRQERGNLGDVDTKFMKSVREFRLQNHVSEDALEDGYRELDSQRDAVGSLQYEYDLAEDEHDEADTKLESEEGKLDALLSSLLKDNTDDEDEEVDPDSSSEGHPNERRDPDEKNEAQVRQAEYESRAGDARILQERLQELLAEQRERLSFSKMKERLGFEQRGSDKAFAEEFDYRYPEIIGELEVVQAEVEQLKNGLIETGLWVPETIPLRKPPDELALQSFSPSNQTQVPILRKRSTSDSVLHYLEKNISSAKARISRWILITIGSSPVERVRHKGMLQTLGDGSIDDKKWARLVFETLKDHDDESSRGSWEKILPEHLLEHMPENRLFPSGASILLSGSLEAENAMNDFKQRFPSEDHAISYKFPGDLELDNDSEYESRSV